MGRGDGRHGEMVEASIGIDPETPLALPLFGSVEVDGWFWMVWLVSEVGSGLSVTYDGMKSASEKMNWFSGEMPATLNQAIMLAGVAAKCIVDAKIDGMSYIVIGRLLQDIH